MGLVPLSSHSQVHYWGRARPWNNGGVGTYKPESRVAGSSHQSLGEMLS